MALARHCALYFCLGLVSQQTPGVLAFRSKRGLANNRIGGGTSDEMVIDEAVESETVARAGASDEAMMAKAIVEADDKEYTEALQILSRHAGKQFPGMGGMMGKTGKAGKTGKSGKTGGGGAGGFFMKQAIKMASGQVFNRFDRDRNGYLDARELNDAISSVTGMVGFRPPHALIQSSLAMFDCDGNGALDKHEFYLLCLQLHHLYSGGQGRHKKLMGLSLNGCRGHPGAMGGMYGGGMYGGGGYGQPGMMHNGGMMHGGMPGGMHGGGYGQPGMMHNGGMMNGPYNPNMGMMNGPYNPHYRN